MNELWKQVESVLVGVWRFRETDGTLKWAGTWVEKGVFYDAYPQATVEDALKTVYTEWQKQCREEGIHRG